MVDLSSCSNPKKRQNNFFDGGSKRKRFEVVEQGDDGGYGGDENMDARSQSRVDYSSNKDIIGERMGNYHSKTTQDWRVNSPYAAGGNLDKFDQVDESNYGSRKNFESSQIDKRESLTEYSLPDSSNYHTNYKPRTRIE